MHPTIFFVFCVLFFFFFFFSSRRRHTRYIGDWSSDVCSSDLNSVRVMPKRFVDHGHPEDGGWGQWARFVLRRPWAVATTGIVIVGVLIAIGVQLNPNESQLKNFPGAGTAIQGRQMLADAGISPG